MDGFGGGNVLTQVRGAWLFEQIVETGNVVLSCAGGDHAGAAAAHCYLTSPQSDGPTIVEALRTRAVEACRGRCVVAVQNTSTLSFARAPGRYGLGPGGDGVRPGFFVHPVVAVDAADEAVLGRLDAQTWSRTPGKVSARHDRPMEEKERLRWITVAQAAAEKGGVTGRAAYPLRYSRPQKRDRSNPPNQAARAKTACSSSTSSVWTSNRTR